MVEPIVLHMKGRWRARWWLLTNRRRLRRESIYRQEHFVDHCVAMIAKLREALEK